MTASGHSRGLYTKIRIFCVGEIPLGTGQKGLGLTYRTVLMPIALNAPTPARY
jgi:hypothetical protein